MKNYQLLSAGLLALFAPILQAKQDISSNIFRDGDVFGLVGDSITHGGFYTEPLLNFYATRFPNTRLLIKNFGISGDTCQGILTRYQDDIKPVKADVYSFMSGMNDVGEAKNDDERNLRRNNYIQTHAQVCELLAKNSRKFIVFTPSIYDELSKGKTKVFVGRNSDLRNFADICRADAKKFNAELVDMWGTTNYANEQLGKIAPEKSVLSADRVHPVGAGGYVMASAFISTLEKPTAVSEIEIDVSKHTGNVSVVKAFNSDVSDLNTVLQKARVKAPKGVYEKTLKRNTRISQQIYSLSFKAFEYALPLYVVPNKKEAESIVKFAEKFNRQILKISGLDMAQNYELFIDGIKVGEFSGVQFAEGVNLAKIETTPQMKQSKKVASLCTKFREASSKYRNIRATERFFPALLKYNNADERVACAKRILNGEEGKINPRYEKYFKKLLTAYQTYKLRQQQMSDDADNVCKAVYAAAKPKAHLFEIKQVAR